MADVNPRLASALADRYRIERELGPGEMATVYLAEDLKHKRKVALKVLKPELAAVLHAMTTIAQRLSSALADRYRLEASLAPARRLIDLAAWPQAPDCGSRAGAAQAGSRLKSWPQNRAPLPASNQ